MKQHRSNRIQAPTIAEVQHEETVLTQRDVAGSIVIPHRIWVHAYERQYYVVCPDEADGHRVWIKVKHHC